MEALRLKRPFKPAFRGIFFRQDTASSFEGGMRERRRDGFPTMNSPLRISGYGLQFENVRVTRCSNAIMIVDCVDGGLPSGTNSVWLGRAAAGTRRPVTAAEEPGPGQTIIWAKTTRKKRIKRPPYLRVSVKWAKESTRQALRMRAIRRVVRSIVPDDGEVDDTCHQTPILRDAGSTSSCFFRPALGSVG